MSESTPEATSLQTTHEKLKTIRSKRDLSARPTKHLRTVFVALDGTERPLKLRYYQIQGMLHLLAMKRFLLGDDTGLG